MEDKKELTKDLLTLSFRELILKTPFDKITIKMITDGAGVIRPTFYKHFQDKYGILEYILQKEIREKIDVLIENQLQLLFPATAFDVIGRFKPSGFNITDSAYQVLD